METDSSLPISSPFWLHESLQNITLFFKISELARLKAALLCLSTLQVYFQQSAWSNCDEHFLPCNSGLKQFVYLSLYRRTGPILRSLSMINNQLKSYSDQITLPQLRFHPFPFQKLYFHDCLEPKCSIL